MEERRDAKRLNSFISAVYNGRECFITDITYEGASLFFTDKITLNKDDIINLSIDLSNITYVINRKINITAKVVWIKIRDNNTFVGLLFINNKEKEDIDLLVKSWQSLKPE